MKIRIIHHHLDPGGVTSIVASQAAALRELGVELEILTGRPPFDGFEPAGAAIAIHPELDYLSRGVSPDEAASAYRGCLDILRRGADSDTITHVHNPTLGKNPSFTMALADFAAAGAKVVCHCHDFAEDRPANLEFLEQIIVGEFGRDLRGTMYPRIANCRFATLTGLDQRRMHDYGHSGASVVVLPNPVSPPPPAPDAAAARRKIVKSLGLAAGKKIVVYPVRVIRRKNIGEFMLLAALFADEAELMVSLPPNNPVEQEEYRRWLELREAHGVPAKFEAGLKVGFADLLTAADFCLTTSVREGFGMAFLEPWLFDTPVVGRDLPNATADMAAEGVKFPFLYQRLLVPDSGGGEVDFPELPLESRLATVAAATASRELRGDIQERNPRLADVFAEVPAATRQHNRELITKTYSVSAYGRKLMDLYAGFK